MFKTLFKRHSSGLMVCANGYVYVPTNNHKYKAHWTAGYRRPDGYCIVRINTKGYFVHRLVAECFLSNPNNYKYVDHINRCRWDNSVDNLRFCDAKNNASNTIVVDQSLEKYGVRCCVDRSAYNHAWYDAHKVERANYNKTYYSTHREEILAEKKRVNQAAKKEAA